MDVIPGKQYIYISGQITNCPNYEEQFEQAEQYLMKRYPGAIIINPAKLNKKYPKSTWRDYMLIDIDALHNCQMMYMIDNWRVSKGACIEYGFGLAEHKTILFENPNCEDML